ncbi:tRNA 2-thiouridine(34) synthase MnmA [Candidatus Peregrinibacteria bacterium CG11_big_fil_rev_8_21_14_0_20_46_8]|nr:MAG: tRNA 2-thiouridine(34) synthase MnmA [Candidatus Peregrinibacteria bacterium CG11_big_fil_rev_8_21_14_0_20_46_8]
MKIALLLSGGVDSSVSLRLLQEQGHEVHAFYLKMWLEDELSYLGECPWREDLQYAEAVCKQAGVPLTVVPIQREYFDRVVSYSLEELRAGRTPSPDVMCNNHIKFGLFLEKMSGSELGADFEKVATGHYAQVREIDGAVHLYSAPDPIKDQTYFLAMLEQQKLQRALFPIGHLRKEEVRKLAEKFALPNKARHDSQGICFLGKLKYRDFVKHYLGEKKGDIIEFESGKKIAEHSGYWFYTLGQRSGIGLSGGPWYVVKKDIEKNIIYISNSYHDADSPKSEKARDEFSIESPNWIAGVPQKQNLEVKLRHGPHKYSCTLNGMHVKIEGQDQGIAPGQFAVFYDREECLGAARIAV